MISMLDNYFFITLMKLVYLFWLKTINELVSKSFSLVKLVRIKFIAQIKYFRQRLDLNFVLKSDRYEFISHRVQIE